MMNVWHGFFYTGIQKGYNIRLVNCFHGYVVAILS